ncbi:uncharacterized protein LOC129887240 [Solanum dulcamara]|uniref:uncharacterized protein LOC129887240 n=1 Tax=Solanum dulcamara TaxID=45834 RepID=UPI0024863237|nr:uncharacterized protein LOC129887240 [Solanum dulcamara]XP_055818232.1 uncharacterized protein LOC129887240 [Solanum dulcamara]
MDCNKEEAIKARGIAEEMMGNRDFVGAKKFASKAQKLFPDLENITQMVLVCEVHCSAENKSFGNEKDWYGILKVEPTADDALIRKQYRKFALLLHPDKNKFPGAADAFSLIGEAQSVLLDRPKRMLYNSRCIPSGRFQVPMPRKSCQPDTRTHPWVQGTQSGTPGSQPTFWTACPFCSVKYKYYKNVLNKILWCHSCKKSYTGHELNDSDATPGTSRSQPTSSQKKGADETLARNPFMQSEVSLESNRNGNSENAYGKMNEGLSGEYKKKNTKRKKASTESSENCDSSTSIDSEGPGEYFQCLGEGNRRRSMRCRQRVTYRDNLSDEDEEEDASKQSKGGGYPSPTKESEVQDLSHAATPNGEKKLKDSLSSEKSMQNTEQEAETANERVSVPEKGSVDLPSDVGPSTMTEPETFDCADPDFSDFDKDKEESCFKVGQVWAVYDTLDAMPRFYAVIRKILSPAFKLRITWLEPDPLNEDETKWLSEGFPASCGRFRLGNSENTEDHPMFSHLACAINRNSYNVIKIFPLEGETWAIFKDWDMNWCSHLESNKKFNYEFVEVLSDYAESIGVHVAYLGKAKGFTCLFHRTGDPFLVPAKDMFRFSHRVPSFKMSGRERNDVPEGSFELDPASLPSDQVGISASCIGQRETANFMAYNLMDSENFAENCAASVPNQVPEPEFYSFDAERSPEKFQIGQCWAMYSDEDALPRYYGQIKKIDHLPDFVLHVAWFYACPLPKGIIQWHDKTMPIGCGLFKFRNSKLNPYTGTNTFSHLVAAEPLKKGVYKIFPRKGEVWAVYKNWSAQLKGSQLEDYEYEIAEIVDVSDRDVDVKFLVWVKGFKSVYKPRVEEEAHGTVKISVSEHLRFSHRIPAFRLTGERGGSLRGFWELDPAAMPLYLLCTD